MVALGFSVGVVPGGHCPGLYLLCEEKVPSHLPSSVGLPVWELKRQLPPPKDDRCQPGPRHLRAWPGLVCTRVLALRPGLGICGGLGCDTSHLLCGMMLQGSPTV